MAELIWEGKYNKQGQKVAPVRYSLPFQTVETVNESAADRKRNLDLLTERHETEWRNRLIWGDKKYVLPSLLKEFAGQVNLIYIDPPFATGANFSYRARIPPPPENTDKSEDSDESLSEFVKQPSIIEEKAYRDTWGRGIDSYLQWFYETAIFLRELLTDNGSIYVHLDWHVGHYVKAVMDEIFGMDNFRNMVVWHYGGRGAKAISGQFPRNYDIILIFSKTSICEIKKVYIEFRVPISDAAKYGYKKDESARWFRCAPRGEYTDESVAKLEKEGRIYRTRNGNIRIKYFLEEKSGFVIDNKIVGDVWADISDMMHTPKDERIDYDTQKPVALLERIISASSNPSDLILDCFVGSGTTAVVAEKLGRRWIACDLSRFAIHTTRKRLLGIPNLKPFIVQNLGKYERQVWIGESFKGENDISERLWNYRKFILELYHAEPITGYQYLHGFKAGRMVYVGSVDSPVTLDDIRNIALELKKSVGKDTSRNSQVDVLYWDLAFEMNELSKQIAAEAGIGIRFLKIPREVMDQKAVEQGDVKFFELASLDVKVDVKDKKVIVKLTDFMMPLEEVPDDVKQSVIPWSQWIDYWAVDWDFKEDTFHNQWQSYRTKKEPNLTLHTDWEYNQPGKYHILIKVIDIFGNDTTKSIKVEIK